MRISDWSSDVCSSDLEITLQLNGLYSYNSDISPFSSQSLNGNTVGRRAPNPTGIPTDIAFPPKPRPTATQRTEERRGGKECVSTGRSGRSTSHKKKKELTIQQMKDSKSQCDGGK